MTTVARHYRTATTLEMRAAPDGLPAGVCGQVEGIAMVYDVVDSHGTTFARGSLDRTIRERVAAGKVRLFFDHGDAPVTGMYDTHMHIGTVRSLRDEQLPDGKWASLFRADIFDTTPGREAHEYLKAIAATKSETGVSVGLLKPPDTTRCTIDGMTAFRISEVALGEISITSMSSVPGTKVTAVRAQLTEAPIDYFVLLDGIVAHVGLEAVRAHVGATVGNASSADSAAATARNAASGDSSGGSRDGTEPLTPDPASMDARLAFVRANLRRLS